MKDSSKKRHVDPKHCIYFLLCILIMIGILRHGVYFDLNAQYQKHQIGCARYQFDARTDSETLLAKSRWTQAMKFVSKNDLTFIKNSTLAVHLMLLQNVEISAVPGMILECGVAKAGSSITFAAIKHPDRCLHLFDTFQGIPPPSDRDGADVHKRYKTISEGKAGKNYYGYMDDLLGFDYNNFIQAGLSPDENHVSFHKGLFQDTVWPAGPVAYAHLDGDWYESTYSMLERITPFLSEGGYLILDDVIAYSGAKNAFEDFFDVSADAVITSKGAQCVVQLSPNTARFELYFDQKVIAHKIPMNAKGPTLTCASKQAATNV